MKRFKVIFSIILALTLILTISITPYAAKKRTSTGTAPVASNVIVSGNPIVGQTLIASYTYYDAQANAEGISTYKWLASSTLSGTYLAITGATSKTYTITSNDVGKYLKFAVTPISATGTPNTGATVSSAAVGPVTDPQIIIPPPPTPSKIVLGFATKYYSTDVSSYNSMVANAASIDQIATVTYSVDAYGNIIGTAPTDQISFAKNNGIKPLALVNNADANGFNGQIAKSIIENPTNVQLFINNLVNVLKLNGYSGVNIDFEGVPYTDRTYFSNFISQIKNALSPLGFMTTVSVPAKTVDSLTNSWNGAFDYKAIGAFADHVILMTYDEHGSWCEPGPVASIGWVTNVVNYAKTVIAPEKIIIGLAAYGYDWSSAGNKALSINKINSLIATYGGSVTWDSVSQTPTYTYTENGITHTIWYENSYSIAFKLNLVNQNNLGGVAIWRLGLEDTAYWTTIKNKLNK